MNKITIELPPADPRLHAHAKGHWREKAKATKELRTLAKALTFIEIRQSGCVKHFDKAISHYTFYLPDNRRRDTPSLIHSYKPAIDGMVDTGLIPDDCWQVLSLGQVQCLIDRKNPRTEITIEEVIG